MISIHSLFKIYSLVKSEMAIIAREEVSHDDDDRNVSAVKTVFISKFNTKRRTTRPGVSVKTYPFTISWTTFRMEILISGKLPWMITTIRLHNESAWPVRANVGLSTPFHQLSQSGPLVFPAHSAGWTDYIPLYRCNTDDLLSPEGELVLKLNVKIVDEMIPGGTSNILRKLEWLASFC